ncbi:ABC transporter substrate-binding protein [Vreelandella janggokensis]|uniref:urea ABC transporter substrate-binding protein n=1 Tax=Vreelandella janggokensis TaxID=370767 RepID=UPI0028612167|nr:ABC transporter substrate-binding protein [Halomonas janggokensis]MDR5886433.1 transporter substrate-binding protein [Halomonas janggokensis]
MTINRRTFLRNSALSVAALSSAQIPFRSALADTQAINIAALYDLSGGLDIYGKPVVDAITLATEEINASGGLLGRPLDLTTYDTQSNMQLYAQYAQQAALRDRASVVHAGITSASREVVRPVLSRYQTLYFYNNQYEGGVCDRNVFCPGVTPSQTVEKLVPHAMQQWGKRVYILAADYNYGRIVSDWVRKYVTAQDGETLEVEFFPLDTTNFGAAIARIQTAQPDFVWSALVGGAHMSFYRQWHAAGLSGEIPIASTTFAGGNEHIVLSPEEANGIRICQNYVQELPNPINKAFVERFHARFGEDYPYITELAMGAWQGMHLWAEGVRRANSTERLDVIEALESGIELDMPSGPISIDPATHHAILDVHIAEVRDGRLELVESFPQQAPVDTAEVCDLITNPNDNQQYTIDI